LKFLKTAEMPFFCLLFALFLDIIYTTEYERAVRFFGKAFNREERICSTAPATVRTPMLLCTAKVGRIKVDKKHQGVVSRETCRTFECCDFSRGCGKAAFFTLVFFPRARKSGEAEFLF
jgi:hypothetical protein